MKVGRRKVKKEVKFRFSFVVLFFAASFLCCFVLYMKENQPESYYKSGGEIIPAAAEETQYTGEHQKTMRYLKNCIFAGGINAEKMAGFGYISEDSMLCGADLSIERVSEAVSEKYITALYLMPDISSESRFDEEIRTYGDIAAAVQRDFPDIDIYMTLLPPSADISETEISDSINELITSFSKENGLYCLDISSALKDKSGVLPDIYSSDEGMEREAYGIITSYILSHTAG